METLTETITPPMQYRFLDAKGEHSHQVSPNGEDWRGLTGTTEALSIVAKPLTWWACGEALKLLGWTPITEMRNNKRVPADKEARKQSATDWLSDNIHKFVDAIASSEDWLKLLDTAYYAHSKTKDKAATSGKDLHSRIENYVKTCIDTNGGKPISGKSDLIQNFIDWSLANVDTFLFSEGHTWSEKHWIGGIVDCGALLKDGRYAIIDFKSSKAVYNSQKWQCGAYQLQIAEKGLFTSDGEQVMEPMNFETHIVVPFGAPKFEPLVMNDTEGVHKRAYLAALELYRIDQKT